MHPSSLSSQALAVLEDYLHFRIGGAECPMPYYNNKSGGRRGALRARQGKGNPEDIREELRAYMIKHHISESTIDDLTMAKLLADQNLGVDCSAFAYHILDAECQARGRGPIDGLISFVNCRGLLGKMVCSMRPAENCDVATLAHDSNSQPIAIADAAAGDLITMTGTLDGPERNHVLVVRAVTPTSIQYAHTIAYPEDGLYATGVRLGEIEIIDRVRPLGDQSWQEEPAGGRGGMSAAAASRIRERAARSATSLRRLIRI